MLLCCLLKLSSRPAIHLASNRSYPPGVTPQPLRQNFLGLFPQKWFALWPRVASAVAARKGSRLVKGSQHLALRLRFPIDYEADEQEDGHPIANDSRLQLSWPLPDFRVRNRAGSSIARQR